MRRTVVLRTLSGRGREQYVLDYSGDLAVLFHSVYCFSETGMLRALPFLGEAAVSNLFLDLLLVS